MVVQSGAEQVGDHGHPLPVDAAHAGHEAQHHSGKSLTRRGIVVLALQSVQCGTPIGSEVHRLGTIAVVAMLLPLPLGGDVGFPGGEQVGDEPVAVAESSPGTTGRRRLQADGLQRREQGTTAGQQDAADLHPQEM